MKHLGDITKIHGDQIEPVDCITFGSPCQDLSIAGRRAGLAGERSGLFMEAVRIIKEMRSSTNGLYPTFAIWENVPGAFSSNGGEDFRAVLEELVRVEQPDASIPRPPKRGRWSKAGAISGDGWSLAWRQLDAQYWGKTIYDSRTGSVLRMGTPQRRKRIALVADFGGQRAGEILFERTSVPGNPDESIKAWEEAPGAAGSRIAGNDRPLFLILNDQGGGVMGVSYNVTGTLRAAEHGHQPIVLESNQVHATVSQTGICPTLPASMGLGGGYVPMVTERKIFDARGNGDSQIAPTITGNHENRITDYTAIAIERKTFNEQFFSHYKESDKCSTLKAKAGNIGNGSECLIAEKAIRWIVRRLTPVECERLQGFPDNYTNIGDWTDSKGKKHKYADSPRYKALGNSIALPQWFWLVQKMRPYLKEKPTLGSLFDGLGGFPLVWQRAYGDGTARWASEIEEFPMAVTKRRFGEE
jgi:DNA (cytosine-5)-methyltransferase 1